MQCRRKNITADEQGFPIAIRNITQPLQICGGVNVILLEKPSKDFKYVIFT